MATPMDNVFSNCFQSFSAGDNIIQLRELVSVIETNNLIAHEKQTGVQDALGHIHTCLSSSKNRPEGLLFLNTFVKQSSTEIFQRNSLTWINLLSQILQSHCSVQIAKASAQILCQILLHAKSFSDLSREITSSVIPQLLPLLLNLPQDLLEVTLTCVCSCITHFPGPVGPFKGKIDKLLLRELEQGSQAQSLHQCYALLSQCGPGGAQGVKHCEAWSRQCGQLLGSLGQTLDRLYEGLESVNSASHSTHEDYLPLDVITRDSSDRVTSLCSRWKALTGCLQALLRIDLGASVKIPVEAIINLVCRCLLVNGNMLLSRPTSERMLLAAFLQEVHICALQVLESLMTGLLRTMVYQVLVTWMKVCGGTSGVLREEKTLMKQIIHDCTPVVEALQMNNTGAKSDGEPSSKKKKKKGYQEITQGSSYQRKLHPLANSHLVEAGLNALYWMVTTNGSEMSRKVIQDVQTFTMTTLLSLQHNVGYPAPYSSAECRKGLYRLLQALTLSQHPGAPSPVQCAIAVLGTGRLDPDIKVSSFCTEAIHICESIIHPRVPCLNGPIVCENLVTIGNQIASNEPIHENGFSAKSGPTSPDVENFNYSGNYGSYRKKRTFEEEESENAESDEVMVTKVARLEDKGYEVKQNRNTNRDGESESETNEQQMRGSKVSTVQQQGTSVESEHQDSPQPGTSQSYEADVGVVSDEGESDSGDDDDDDETDKGMSDNNGVTSEETDVENKNGSEDGKKEIEVVNLVEESVDVEDDEEGEVSPTPTSKKQDEQEDMEVGAMLASFVDASPDSD